MHVTKRQIYWANALFTEADRRFNAYYVKRLREAGYDVFLPQEASVNEEILPTAEDIFHVDTTAIINYCLLITCLDQETIDSGVASEIGLAYAFGIPIIGLYTDIRQYRRGPGKMYKNLYVIGAIESIGEIVTSVGELLKVLPRYLPDFSQKAYKQKLSELVEKHYENVASRYSGFVEQLESWYKPLWNSRIVVDRWVQLVQPKHVLDFGCGTGNLGYYLCDQYPVLSYLGYDMSLKMVTLALSSYQSKRCTYTSNLQEVIDQANRVPFDLAIVLFNLHDHPDRKDSISLLKNCIRKGGYILIVDLCTQDLPKLNQNLKYGLGRPITLPDFRIDSLWLSEISREQRLNLVKCELVLPSITFPSSKVLDRYLEIFGVYSGMDLPLGFKFVDRMLWQERVRKLLSKWKFPFTDQRVFIMGVLEK